MGKGSWCSGTREKIRGPLGWAEAVAWPAHIAGLLVHGVKPLLPHRWAKGNRNGQSQTASLRTSNQAAVGAVGRACGGVSALLPLLGAGFPGVTLILTPPSVANITKGYLQMGKLPQKREVSQANSKGEAEPVPQADTLGLGSLAQLV